MRDHRDSGVDAPLDHPSAQRAIVEDAQGDLDRRDRRELERVVELSAIDVRHADPLDDALLDQAREGADRRSPRRPRIGSVEQIQIDLDAVQSDSARFAVTANRLGAPVRHPAAARSRQPPLVTTRALPAPQHRRARASRRSLWPSSDSPRPYARAVSNTVTPASAAAAIVSTASCSSRLSSVDMRMHPRPTRSSDGSSHPGRFRPRRLRVQGGGDRAGGAR